MKKSIDRCFLHYGIRQEDMSIIEQVSQQADVDAEWLKENILKPYNEARNDENIDDKHLRKLLNSAIKKI